MQQQSIPSRLSAPRGPFLLFFKLLLGITLATLAACSGGGSGGSSPAVNDTYSTTTGATLTVPKPGVLANDSGSALTASWKTSPSHGSLILNSDGSFTYQNHGDGAPGDSFTYTLNSGGSAIGVATVNLTINQAPVAATSFATIHDNDASVTVNLQATDANGNNTIASYSIDTSPGNGSISGCIAPCSLANGFLTYVPNSNSTGQRGMDKFTFHVTDAGGLPSGSATAWILNNGNVRIMPLGDSITAGVTINNDPLSPVRIGYRYDLYTGLTTLAAGKYGIDFVGSQSDGANYTFDLNHEGHPGWCANKTIANNQCAPYDGIAENVSTFLTNKPADVILLHIGTNGFTTDASGVGTILDNINTWAASNYPVTVMVARIIPATNGSLDVQAFNNNVASIIAAPTFQSNHPYLKVFMVNQQSELHLTSDPTGNVADSTLMASVLHPNDINGVSLGSPYGYGKMAQRWQTDLTNDNVVPVP